MRVCVLGAGAIGGFIGARLAASGRCELSAFAVGTTLAAMRVHGWRLHQGDQLIQAPARVSDQAAELGRHDLVIVAVKAQALPEVAATVAALLAADGIVLPAMNGVPWWFCHGTAIGERPLASVDPGGRVSSAIPFPAVLGCVVHASCTRPEPGVVRHAKGQGLIVGEPAGGISERATAVGQLLQQAGFDVTVSPRVRYDIWYKLWGNLTMNPISALTGATVDRVLADPLARAFCSAAMTEAAVVGAGIGCPIDQSPEDRHAITARLGAFKTSMLQDVEAERPIELDAIVTAVHEIGRRLGEPTPNIDALLGLTRLFARTRRLYPASGD